MKANRLKMTTNPITDILEMQLTKQVVRSVKTKRCLSAASSFSLAKQDVVLSALLSSLDLLFLSGQAKRKCEMVRLLMGSNNLANEFVSATRLSSYLAMTNHPRHSIKN